MIDNEIGNLLAAFRNADNSISLQGSNSTIELSPAAISAAISKQRELNTINQAIQPNVEHIAVLADGSMEVRYTNDMVSLLPPPPLDECAVEERVKQVVDDLLCARIFDERIKNGTAKEIVEQMNRKEVDTEIQRYLNAVSFLHDRLEELELQENP